MSAPERSPPDALERADDYVSGHMDDAEAASYEEDLFAQAGQAAPGFVEPGFVDQLTRACGVLAAFSDFLEGATRAHVDALRAAGARVHFVDLGAGGATTFPAWGPDVDVVVARLGVDLRGRGLVDVEVERADGRRVKTFREVIWDPTDGALYAICQEPLARMAFGTGRSIARVVATQDGRRETVAVFDLRPA